MTGREGVGARTKRGITGGMLAKPGTPRLPAQLLPLYPDQHRRMVPWKTEGHKGPQEAPGSGDDKCCHALNETVNLLIFPLNGQGRGGSGAWRANWHIYLQTPFRSEALAAS